MRIKYICIIALAAFGVLSLASCMKEGKNIFNMFDVAVEFHGKSPYAVTDYKEVSDGDSVYLDFTITSPSKDMYYVCAFEVGSMGPFKKINLHDDQRRSFSDIIRLKANVRAGTTTYRIWALDANGIYLGDGYKTVTVAVKPNFTYYINRYIYNPDSVTKTNDCYLSLQTGETFNYLTGGNNAGKIDVGLYSTVTPAPELARTYYIYSLAATAAPFNIYDISGWQKRRTLFAPPKANQSVQFLAIGTASAIDTLAKVAKPTLTAITTPIAAGSVVYFLTPENKYGALMVQSIGADNKGRFLNMSIKIQQ